MWWFALSLLLVWLWLRRESFTECKPGDISKYEYTRRIDSTGTGTWVCPAGWSDTGCSWEHGEVEGERQCRRRVQTRTETAGGSWIKCNISYYGQNPSDDNGEGIIGVNLMKLGTSGLSFNGRPVYPIAVHHDHAPEYLFKVLEIKGTRVNPLLGYVADICNRNDGECKNVSRNGLNFLVDIHKTGFAAAGTADGKDLTTGECRVVGAIPPSQIPKHTWLQGDNTWFLCKCSGKCDKPGKDQDWRSVKDVAKCV